MKKATFGVIIGLLIAGLWAPPVVEAADEGGMRDVIIQTDGSSEKLLEYIRSVGGEVTIRYRNVNAFAARVPVEALAKVATLEGVDRVSKDRMMYMTDTVAGGKNSSNPESYVVEDSVGLVIGPGDLDFTEPFVVPDGYANFVLTGAMKIWPDTFAGEGSIVAVVDSGVAPNACLQHAVVGAPGFPDGYNATADGVPATSPTNFWHGTHVAGVISSACALDYSATPDAEIYKAQEPFLGWPVDFVPIYGQAPGAQIYPVKVFPESGAGSPTSVILDGLDHILTLKKSGEMDIDIINMSLGGPTGWDARDPYDRFMSKLRRAGMIVITSSGNSGPVPNTVGSPGTALATLSVAALDYAESSRTFYEWLGLARWPLAPGMGLIMRPTDEVRISNFSSRGPLSDGTLGSEIAALGSWNFHVGPQNELRWAGGTSFAAPTVAGVAALLNAWWEAEGHKTDPWTIEDTLLFSANPDLVGDPWKDVNAQGFGVLDAVAAFEMLISGECIWKDYPYPGPLHSNVLGWANKGQTQVWESDTITIGPNEPFDAVFDIGIYTSNVLIEVFDVVTPDNSSYAYWGNALEIHVQSAKRTTYEHAIDGIFWYTSIYGDAFDIVIDDGSWTFWDIPWAEQPMEPGLMKLSMIGDSSNEEAVSFKVRITRENDRMPWKRDRITRQKINQDDSILIPVEIPDGVAKATFDLEWNRNWSRFPTNDLDMYVFDPDGALVSFDAATANSPEREVVENPMAGMWYVQVDGYEVFKKDRFSVYLTTEEIAP